MSTVLVFGATGGTGKHFIKLALDAGHKVKAVVRTPSKVTTSHQSLQVIKGSIVDDLSQVDRWVQGCNTVVAMVGDAAAQQKNNIATAFIKQLVPSMRRHGANKLLYQAGGFSTPYGESLPWSIWLIKKAVVTNFAGQHRDNEAVMEYLVEEAKDIDWIVTRPGINGDGPSKGTLRRSPRSEGKINVGNFGDVARYTMRVLQEDDAVHTMDLCCYE